MNTGNLLNSVMTIPAIRRLMLPTNKGGLGLTRAELVKDVRRRIPGAITEVVTAFPWDFAIKETTFTTVINTGSYTLAGDDNDCLSIFYVKVTDTDKEIISKTINSMNEIRNDNRDIIDCRYWIPDGRDGGSPKIKIIGTPSTAKSITYQYWRNNISIGNLASDFDLLTIECLAKRFVVSREAIYERQLTKVMRNYDRPNAKTDIGGLDPQVKLNYQRYVDINGW